MNSNRRGTAASATLPPWFWGNDLLGYARKAQLKLHAVDAANFRWRIEALERHENRTAHLIEKIDLAGSGQSARWDALDHLPATSVRSKISPELVEQKRRELVEGAPSDFLAKLNWLHLSMTLAPDDQFIPAAKSAFDFLNELGVRENDRVFPALSASFIRFDQALNWRAALPRVLLRVEEEPGILKNRPTQVPGQITFGAGWNLLSDLALTREAYLAPLFLCQTPWVWAIVGPRQQGVMVFNLGKAISGREGEAAELLQQFMPPGPSRSTPRPLFTSEQLAATLAWWVDSLNSMMSIATDPATYVNDAGEYSPRGQFEAQLSLEQAGRRIQAILSHQRDQPTRRLLAFAALDTLEGLGFISFASAVTLSKAEKTLAGLGTLLPSDVADVLLPLARRAVEALRQCQQGFFPGPRVSGGRIRVPHKNGRDRDLTGEEACAQYLRILRNANHGFRAQKDAGQRRDEALLASHTGQIPDDLVLLPYLYWIHALAEPQRLRNSLRPR